MPAPTETSFTLTDETTRQEASQRLSRYLPLRADGYECSTEMILDILLKGSSTRQTIETTCNNQEHMVLGETIRGYLNDQIRVDDLHRLEQNLNQAPSRWSAPPLKEGQAARCH